MRNGVRPETADDLGMPRLVNARQLAKPLGICKSTVYRLVRDGKIPAIRLGGVLRFDVARVAEALRK